MTRAGQDRIADPDGVEAEALGPRGEIDERRRGGLAQHDLFARG